MVGLAKQSPGDHPMKWNLLQFSKTLHEQPEEGRKKGEGSSRVVFQNWENPFLNWQSYFHVHVSFTSGLMGNLWEIDKKIEKLVKTQVDTKLNTPSKITSTHCANKRKFVPYSDIKELCIFSLSYYGDDIGLRSWKKIPMMLDVWLENP